uniref:Uncharacterized protein n=1 Tax=Anguilla anguilla TaxID=7936 RepID=A0A0E9RY77_ANGAN
MTTLDSRGQDFRSIFRALKRRRKPKTFAKHLTQQH